MKYIFTLCFLILIVSCGNKKSKIVDTNDYSIKFKKASIFHKDYSNTISVNPLIIDVERIALSELLNIIFKNDSTFFQFKNEKISGLQLETTLLLKKENIDIKKEILELIINELNLKSELENSKLFEIKINDTTKIFNHYSANASNNKSTIYKSRDSFALKNTSLKKISTLINERFNINTFSNNTTAIIDFNIKINDLKSFKEDLTNKLGTEFIDTNKKQITYIISDK